MALSSDTRNQVIDFYFDGDAQVPQKYEPMFVERTDQAGTLKLGGKSTEGTNSLPEWVGGQSDIPQARVSDIGSKTLTFAQYAIQFRIRKLDAKFNPTLVGETSMQVGRAVANTKALLAAAVVNGAHSTTTVVPGTKTLAATDHPTALGGTRSNKLATACDLAAIFAAMALARLWKDYDGGDFDLAEGGWYLFHPIVAGLEQTIAQALGSQYTSDQNQINTAGNFNITQIPWAKVTTATHWGLVSKVIRSLIMWEVLSPEDSIEVDEDSREIKITVDGAWGAGCNAMPSGFIGATT